MIWFVDLDLTEGLGDHETLCQLVKGPSMLKRSWASSLNVPIKLCFLEGGSELDRRAKPCWDGRAGLWETWGQTLIETAVV